MSAPESDASRVYIFDTTLRDGEQSPGISLTTDEKLEIAHQLARLGVDIIEAGFPITSPGDFEAVAGDRAQGRGPDDRGLARTHKADIDAAWEAVRDAGSAPHPHLHLDLRHPHRAPAADDREDVKGKARAAVALRQVLLQRRRVLADGRDPLRRRVHRRGLRGRDRGRRDDGQHPRHRRLHDPGGVRRVFRRLCEQVPDFARSRISVHCHNDLGLAVANSLAGVLAGARQVECAINGIGERAGNASLEEIVMCPTREDCTACTPDVNTRELSRTSRMVSRLTG